MALARQVGWWLRLDASVGLALAAPGLVDPAGVATFFGAEEPAYSFVVRLCSGLLFVFGWASWEASRNLGVRAALVKYLWLEKATVVASVLAGDLGGEASPGLTGLVLLTNLPWLAAWAYADVSRRLRCAGGR